MFVNIHSKIPKWFIASLLFFHLLGCNGSGGSPLKIGEDVIFFPTSANQIDKNNWNITIHHWVFEKEQQSISRRLSQKALAELIETLGVSEEQAHSPVFQQRMMWFLVDNERNKKIKISINQQHKELNTTAANGHAITTFVLQNNAQADLQLGEWIDFKTSLPSTQTRIFTGQVQLIPETGLSVISDIDDTIKISEVLDKKALIRNTFVNEYKTTQGFPEYYQTLKKQQAYFHYVSAAPWQLYPSLKPFLDEHYPQGSVYMRNFRLKDSSLIAFLKPSVEYKINQIKNIISRYPKHQFILIGDSGERDPEVYAQIYAQFKANIKAIKIRAITGSDLSEKRFQETFKQVPKSIWEIVSIPKISSKVGNN